MNRLASAVAGAAVGIGVAVGLDEVLKRALPEQRSTTYAALLVGAGAVYPLARSKDRLGSHSARELVALGAYGAVGALAARANARVAEPMLGAGWASHAVFDILHDTGRHSRIPDWYPAFCAAYDISLATLLIRTNANQR